MNKLTAEKCREQFEEWWEQQWCGEAPMDGWEFIRGDDGYIDEGINSQWEAWRASRESLEIALPVLEQQESAGQPARKGGE